MLYISAVMCYRVVLSYYWCVSLVVPVGCDLLRLGLYCRLLNQRLKIISRIIVFSNFNQKSNQAYLGSKQE